MRWRFFFFQAEGGIRDGHVTGVQTCALPIWKKLALFNLEGSFHAIDDTCTHRGGPLSEGEVSGDEVTCPWHGAVYNIRSEERRVGKECRCRWPRYQDSITRSCA